MDMRTLARKTVILTALVCSMGLAGCRHLEREIEYHFGPLPRHAEASAIERERPRPVQRTAQARQLRGKVAARTIASPRAVNPGNRIRQFCGRRHIQFQRGTLRETAAEAGRNNVLCSQNG